MCAIAGVIGRELSGDVLREMLETMRRRGPDGSGSYQDADVRLLHSRLAVIDPAGGKQPMVLELAGERYVLVYNGELYNTPELRRELEGLGHRFQGHSDTEVLVHAYAQFGEGCLERLNGIYAFAVWEEKSRQLFLARDRMGVKPLFFTRAGNMLAFASEMKTLFQIPGIRPALDREGAAQLILLGPGRLPGSGVFHGIRELEPGWCGRFADGRLQLRQYWKLRDREHTDSFQDTVEHVRWLVTDAVRRQTVSDVPLGTFLSGGLDSSIITALCAGDGGLATFSVDYADQDRYFVPGKFQPDSDGEYISLMCERFQTDHHTTVLTPEALLDGLEAATWARDLPGMADVDFSLLAFCGRIRPHVKVALSGECADEIFGGYPWYRDPEVRARAGFPWAQNTAQRTALLAPGLMADGEAYIMDAYTDCCRESDILPGTTATERRMKEMVNLNQRWFMQTLLDRKDRMSMYHSLEVRVPFCDHRIAEYLYGVPWEFKDCGGREKGLLRHAMKGLLPERVLLRKKSPYPKTFDPRYGELVAARFRSLLADGGSPVFSLLRRDGTAELLHARPQWPWYGQLMGLPQTMAYILQLEHWLKRYNVELLF